MVIDGYNHFFVFFVKKEVFNYQKVNKFVIVFKEVLNMKTIIIGGVAGGATCATRLRRLDEKMEIRIYEKTNYVSYANFGLPYF